MCLGLLLTNEHTKNGGWGFNEGEVNKLVGQQHDFET